MKSLGPNKAFGTLVPNRKCLRREGVVFCWKSQEYEIYYTDIIVILTIFKFLSLLYDVDMSMGFPFLKSAEMDLYIVTD